MEIRTDQQVAALGLSKEVVKIVWQGERIAKLVFASGRVIDFTRADRQGQGDDAPGPLPSAGS